MTDQNSREEAMNALIESGMELRRDDIELGKKLEQERIIKLLEDNWVEPMDWLTVIALIKGEQK